MQEERVHLPVSVEKDFFKTDDQNEEKHKPSKHELL